MKLNELFVEGKFSQIVLSNTSILGILWCHSPYRGFMGKNTYHLVISTEKRIFIDPFSPNTRIEIPSIIVFRDIVHAINFPVSPVITYEALKEFKKSLDNDFHGPILHNVAQAAAEGRRIVIYSDLPSKVLRAILDELNLSANVSMIVSTNDDDILDKKDLNKSYFSAAHVGCATQFLLSNARLDSVDAIHASASVLYTQINYRP